MAGAGGAALAAARALVQKGAKATLLGVVTARAGSKGIPGKNTKLLAGKPLIAYTIEASLPLHGNDIDPDTDAISAGLGWTCALAKAFTGVEALRRVKEDGPVRKLAAFVMEERAVPRQGMPIVGGGEVTSGTHSPMLDVGIGLGYVPAATAAPDSEITIDVRGKPRRARIVKKPIYKREES